MQQFMVMFCSQGITVQARRCLDYRYGHYVDIVTVTASGKFVETYETTPHEFACALSLAAMTMDGLPPPDTEYPEEWLDIAERAMPSRPELRWIP